MLKKLLSIFVLMMYAVTCFVLPDITSVVVADVPGIVPAAGVKDEFTRTTTDTTENWDELTSRYICEKSNDIYFIKGNFWDRIGFNTGAYPVEKYVPYGVTNGSQTNEIHIKYDLSNLDLTKLTVSASVYYMYDDQRCGAATHSGARAHLLAQLPWEGVKFIACNSSGAAIGQISLSEGDGMAFNLARDEDFYGTAKNEVVYTITPSKIPANTKYLKIAFPAVQAARDAGITKITDISTLLDYVDFQVATVIPTPTPTLTPTATPVSVPGMVPAAGAKDEFTRVTTDTTQNWDELTPRYICEKSNDIYFIKGNFWDRIGFNTGTYIDEKYVPYGVTNGSQTNELHIKYDLSNLDLTKLTITASVYYMYDDQRCGAASHSGARAHLLAQLPWEGVKFIACNSSGAAIGQISLAEGNGMTFNLARDGDFYGTAKSEVVYTITPSKIPANTKYLKIAFPAVQAARDAGITKINDNSTLLDYVDFQVSSVTPTPTPVSTPTPTLAPTPTPTPIPTSPPTGIPYYKYDTLDNAMVMLSKSNNISFYTEALKTDSHRDTPYTSSMARRDNSSDEGYITYELDTNPIEVITVESYHHDNVGYAGTSGSATGLQRLDAALQYEGIRFYESTNNSTFTQIASGNIQLIKEVSPWPGITAHHVTYKVRNLSSGSRYFKIVYPQLTPGIQLYPWSTRVDNVEFKYASGGTSSGGYEWVNPANYPVNRICVVRPEYTSTINGNTEIVICARGFSQVTAKCWNQGSGFGTNQTVATVNLDSRGVGGFVFPAGQYPHGPVTIVITGTSGALVDECNLQLYNAAGVSWNEGVSTAPVPSQINGLGLSLVYQDDFTNSNLSIHQTDSTKKYSAHTMGYLDFSGIPFRDYESAANPFSQVDTYMRIRADQNINSSGLISSIHQDGKGFAVKMPAYFECKFIAQNAKGTWPAFWTLTNKKRSQFSNGECDELDVIEGYGFDSTQPQFAGNNGYEAVFHAWDQNPRVEQGSHVNMKSIGGQGMWYQGFHTYGVLITATDTVYYCDNIEVWRHATLPVSKVDYHYFLINLAVGGNSGWPFDLSRYGGKADMYVDWVRVYGLPQNIQINQ